MKDEKVKGFVSLGLFISRKELSEIKERIKAVVHDSAEYWYLIGKMEGLEAALHRLSDV